MGINLDEEFWMQEAGSKDEVKHVGRSHEWLRESRSQLRSAPTTCRSAPQQGPILGGKW